MTAYELDRATSPTYGHSARIQAATHSAAEKLAAEVAVMQAERGAA